MEKVHEKTGFSLLELMIVVLILGIIATTALPSLKSGVDQSRLAAATEEIVTALEYARLFALTTGTQSRVTIDATANTVWVQRFKNTANFLGAEAQLPKADVEGGSFLTMTHPFNRGASYYTVFSDEDRFDGVDIASSVFGAGNFITFGALGVPSSSGTVTLSLGSKLVTIAVNGTTGRVTTSG
jgi:prepilin-type N-terminal cleavage/methylation domain-containing protein